MGVSAVLFSGLAFGALDPRLKLPEIAAGLFEGTLTNTPALAAILESAARSETADPSLPVVGYSIAYPVGVLGVILAIALSQRLWKADYGTESERLREFGVTDAHLGAITLVLVHPDADEFPVTEIVRREGLDLILTRAETDMGVARVGPETRVPNGSKRSLRGCGEEMLS